MMFNTMLNCPPPLLAPPPASTARSMTESPGRTTWARAHARAVLDMYLSAFTATTTSAEGATRATGLLKTPEGRISAGAGEGEEEARSRAEGLSYPNVRGSVYVAWMQRGGWTKQMGGRVVVILPNHG